MIIDYIMLRPQHLQAGDVIQQRAIVHAVNECRHQIALESWRLLASVCQLSGHVWLAENVHTCEQRVIEIKHSEYYVCSYHGVSITAARRGQGTLIERAYFWQYIPEGV